MCYPDSEVTTHIMNNGKILTKSHPYYGQTSVITAKREAMGISHLANARASGLKLNDILVIPDSSRNLLSVNQICKDNNVYVEFDKQKVRVCNKETREVLAKGKEEDGLYQHKLIFSKNQTALLGELKSAEI